VKGGDPVPSVADLLGPGDRERLAALAGQAAGLDLAGVALAAAPTPDQARAALDRVLDDPQLKTTALACLGALTDTVR